MPTSSRLLSCEWVEDDERLEIHANTEGILYLRSVLDHLLATEQPGHIHLMTKEWSGTELSSERQNVGEGVVLINHVKVMIWPEQS